jgi:hypothetical protein
MASIDSLPASILTNHVLPFLGDARDILLLREANKELKEKCFDR